MAPAQEAVELYRALARANPDAFTPDLAMALNNLANRLSELGRHAEALASYAEGLRLLTPHFLALPEAHQSLTALLVNTYERLCGQLGQPPETELFAAVKTRLASLPPPT